MPLFKSRSAAGMFEWSGKIESAILCYFNLEEKNILIQCKEYLGATAIQVAEVDATYTQIIIAGVAAKAQVPVSQNARIMQEKDKTKDASTMLLKDKVVTSQGTNEVIGAEIRTNQSCLNQGCTLTQRTSTQRKY